MGSSAYHHPQAIQEEEEDCRLQVFLDGGRQRHHDQIDTGARASTIGMSVMRICKANIKRLTRMFPATCRLDDGGNQCRLRLGDTDSAIRQS